MAENALNLVVIGPTGVGKSTFLNYLLGEEFLETSKSSPRTIKGFWETDSTIRGFPVHLIDSWGLERGKADDWILYLEEELQKRGVNEDITQWFHGVCYLIAATECRVQEFDLEIISKLQAQGYSIVVVLTKAAKVDRATIQQLTFEIGKRYADLVPVIAVNGVKEQLLDGHIVEPFGIEDFEQELVKRFWHTIQHRIPLRIQYRLETEVVNKWDKIVIQGYLDALEDRDYFKSDKIADYLKNRAEDLKRHIAYAGEAFTDEEIQVARKTYAALAECLDVKMIWSKLDSTKALDLSFTSQVSNPSTWSKFWDYATLHLHDASIDQRRRLRAEAEQFSKSLKDAVAKDLMPSIVKRIRSTNVNVAKLSKRKSKGRFLGLFRRVFKIFSR